MTTKNTAVREGYKRIKRLSPGMWLYECLRCGREVKSASAGFHDYKWHTDVDPTPRETTFKGTDGCSHIHYMPNVKPSGCAYCSGTE